MNRPAQTETPKPEPVRAPKPPPPQTVQMNTADVASDPLVKSVLEVFEGEIKRVHPKNS
ncbi:MAG: hypothetical protein JKY96_02055 [Phycisphaerales bacterium]|nr:hypothetical protein [Phycisphaerales bacterium]